MCKEIPPLFPLHNDLGLHFIYFLLNYCSGTIPFDVDCYISLWDCFEFYF